jgi:hypothetical protein
VETAREWGEEDEIDGVEREREAGREERMMGEKNGWYSLNLAVNYLRYI